MRTRRTISVAGASVVTPSAPTITAPANLAVVVRSTGVPVTATAVAGIVPDRIDWVLDPGVGEEVVATDAASPYSQTWNVAADAVLGAHTMVARLILGAHAIDSAAVNITINAA